MTKAYTIHTKKEEMRMITDAVRQFVKESGVQEGICTVYCPHTTAGITINENADPDVRRDFLLGLSRTFPTLPEFRHAEGNSAAHLKSSCVGCSAQIPILNGELLLGTWQGVYFCEFDGPRTRKFYIQITTTK